MILQDMKVKYYTIRQKTWITAKRVEYRQMQTSLNLQNAEIGYYRWSFIPTLSAYYDYEPTLQNDQFADLYNNILSNPGDRVETNNSTVPGIEQAREPEQGEAPVQADSSLEWST